MQNCKKLRKCGQYNRPSFSLSVCFNVIVNRRLSFVLQGGPSADAGTRPQCVEVGRGGPTGGRVLGWPVGLSRPPVEMLCTASGFLQALGSPRARHWLIYLASGIRAFVLSFPGEPHRQPREGRGQRVLFRRALSGRGTQCVEWLGRALEEEERALRSLTSPSLSWDGAVLLTLSTLVTKLSYFPPRRKGDWREQGAHWCL